MGSGAASLIIAAQSVAARVLRCGVFFTLMAVAGKHLVFCFSSQPVRWAQGLTSASPVGGS